jgi:acyl-CoA reductase-like NAD-dependent aldehyde dehydrogenase
LRPYPIFTFCDFHHERHATQTATHRTAAQRQLHRRRLDARCQRRQLCRDRSGHGNTITDVPDSGAADARAAVDAAQAALPAWRKLPAKQRAPSSSAGTIWCWPIRTIWAR